MLDAELYLSLSAANFLEENTTTRKFLRRLNWEVGGFAMLGDLRRW